MIVSLVVGLAIGLSVARRHAVTAGAVACAALTVANFANVPQDPALGPAFIRPLYAFRMLAALVLLPAMCALLGSLRTRFGHRLPQANGALDDIIAILRQHESFAD